jgi:hypothetical protein
VLSSCSGQHFDAGLAQGLSHEVGLGGGIGVAIMAMRSRQYLLEICIAPTQVVVSAQLVPEGEQLVQVRVIVLDQVEMVGSGLGPWTQKPQPP